MRILLLMVGIILLCAFVFSVCVQQEFSPEKPNDIIENQNTVFILDPENEHIEVVPGTSFYVERTVDGLFGTEAIFTVLFSDALMFEKMEFSYDSEDELRALEIFENDRSIDSRVYSAGRPVSRLEKIIDKYREKLTSDLSQLDKVAYSQPFRLKNPCTVRIWFQAPIWEEITCGCKPSSGRISYLVFSDDGSDGYDYESSTWWDSGWDYRKLITINSSQVPANLNNFPILVNITDTDLRDDAQNDGDDIVFTNATGTKLNHEIELFNGTSGELVCWVNVTSLSSSSNTEIWMYYNNSGCSSQENIVGVWDSNYVMVQHLQEDPTDSAPEFKDSTGEHNGTSVNLDAEDQMTGIVDGSLNFDLADTEHVTVPHSADIVFDINDDFTVSTWAYLASLPGAWAGIVTKSRDDAPWYGIWISNANVWAFGTENGAGADNLLGSSVTTGWHYVVAVQEGGVEKNIYVDGVNQGTGPAGNANGAGDIWIGGAASVSEYLESQVDEVRISNTTRNASWINTSYNTMNSPSTFLHFGSENSCTVPNNNDWNISTYCTLVNTIELMAQDKDINILSGGRLDIINSTLTMNLTADGNSNIYVFNGGTLFINDSTLNTTNITNNPKIIAYSGSNLEVRNSILTYWGYDAGSPEGAIDIYTDNVTIDSNNFSNCYQAVYGYNIDNITINNNRIVDFTKDALDFNGLNNSEITNNFVSNSGTDDAFNLYNVLNTVVSGNTINGTIDDGLSIDGAVNLTLSNNQYSNVSDRVINIDDYEQACSEITLTNETISSSPVGVSLGYGSNSFGNVTVVDCNITTTTGDAFELFGTNGNNVTVYNTQFNKSRVSVGAGWVALIVKWSFNAYVNNSNGQPIDGATVNVTDVFNEQTASELTNSTGWIQQQNITEFSENSSSRTYHTNYTINVSKSGYASSSQSENISDSTTLYITLAVANNAPTIDLINPSPNGTTDINIQPTCQIWANDTDGDTLNVTWGTNESGSWVNKHTNTSITANSTVSYQFIDFDTFSRTYYWMAYADDGMENVSGWFYFATEAIDTSTDTTRPSQVPSSAVSTPLSLYLESPNFVYEGEEFTIIVRNSLSTGNVMEGVLVNFNDISKNKPTLKEKSFLKLPK